MTMKGSARTSDRSSAASSPSEVAALLMRWPRIGVWLSTKANGFLQARTVSSVETVASISATLGRAGIRQKSLWRMAAVVAALVDQRQRAMRDVASLA